MTPTTAVSRYTPPASSNPTLEAREAANDEAHAARQSTDEGDSLGPLWVITIAMGAFFGIAALVIGLG